MILDMCARFTAMRYRKIRYSVFIVVAVALCAGVSAIEEINKEEGSQNVEKAMFGAGCFWGVEAAFLDVKGVLNVTSGYSGGTLASPSYKDVSSGMTGHAEVVQIEYDPSQIPYGELLEIFWKIHDPTTPDRQGPDIGTQYRSVIFYYNEGQKRQAIASKKTMQNSGKYKNTIVTEIVPASPFYRAEEYHQRYLAKRGISTCHTQADDAEP